MDENWRNAFEGRGGRWGEWGPIDLILGRKHRGEL